MTITINIYFIIYWALATVFNTFYLIFAWKKTKRDFKTLPYYDTAMEYYRAIPALQKLYKSVFSPLSLAVFFMILTIISPVLFPSFLFTATRKALGIKTKKELAAELRIKELRDAELRDKKFMENEGLDSGQQFY